ncbi:hypothetical protein O181_000890 [Austropuccinia psidii MF-1]|uniref:Uncharacterized protein n=1 Tax=Austropuccinia psidii MF-1 TaxID=1389203 RepID=A0A9Q3B9W7_9BASI|nr:hypothetical protein [Austropuccinia psidii MF-1]
MGDAIREQSDDDQDPREEFPVPRGHSISNPRHTVGSRHATIYCQQKLVQTHKRCTNIPSYTNQRYGIHTWSSHKMTVCIDHSQHPLIIDSGAHCFIVARNYLDNYFPN